MQSFLQHLLVTAACLQAAVCLFGAEAAAEPAPAGPPLAFTSWIQIAGEPVLNFEVRRQSGESRSVSAGIGDRIEGWQIIGFEAKESARVELERDGERVQVELRAAPIVAGAATQALLTPEEAEEIRIRRLFPIFYIMSQQLELPYTPPPLPEPAANPGPPASPQ